MNAKITINELCIYEACNKIRYNVTDYILSVLTLDNLTRYNTTSHDTRLLTVLILDNLKSDERTTTTRVAKVSADAYGIMTYAYGIMTFAPLVQFAYVETQKWCSHMRRHVVPKFCLVNSHSNLLGVLTLNLGLITNLRKMTVTKVKVANFERKPGTLTRAIPYQRFSPSIWYARG